MAQALRTVFYERHLGLGAKLTEFGGWDMPLQFHGIVKEHLATRSGAGLFDVSHMGRFVIRGPSALAFLQHVLTNNSAGLTTGLGQYTIIANEAGGAVDDAYLYRFFEGEYLLVVNAGNRTKDWEHLQELRREFSDTEMVDRTLDLAMLSLQGPRSKEILTGVLDSGELPEPMRNALGVATVGGVEVWIARTGYTGEPICFELFVESGHALEVWDSLLDRGATPVGLGARDTLRLEAALPLYGHELGLDPEGNEIPVFASGLSRFAVSFAPLKGAFVGAAALEKQFRAFKRIVKRDQSLASDLPRVILPVELSGKGVCRAGDKVYRDSKHVGHVTSGTMVPYWMSEGAGLESRWTQHSSRRAIGLALIDSHLRDGDTVEIEIRGKPVGALIVPYFLRTEAPPFARPIIHQRKLLQGDSLQQDVEGSPASTQASIQTKVSRLLDRAISNTVWRQQQCINLIPSEQTFSPMAKLLSILDPVGRYAEHKRIKALAETEVFYYQGTDFIGEVEELLQAELQKFLECSLLEARVISGQMANTTVFSAMVDFLNRTDRKSEQRRMRRVLNNHIIRGGHLSAQPMGALRDFVARDPKTEKAAVVNFPVLKENPYRIDVAATRELIAKYEPELIILGKSMTLHPEPVAAVRQFVDDLNLDCIIMNDMAHVLGLVGRHFQRPFQEGADVVTGSTHKTFYGTQRGIIAADYSKQHRHFPFWEAIERRAFPGAVSNHHLGTLVGLLMASYEMNHFKDDYQPRVLANAKSFARSLRETGLDVAGDPDVSFTETHQVIVKVGYAKGPEVADRLEENNIVVNYQASPDEEGFTTSGSLRMGVAEMTRFGMESKDFGELAELIRDCIVDGTDAKDAVTSLRQRFLELRYCFSGDQFEERVQQLHRLV